MSRFIAASLAVLIHWSVSAAGAGLSYDPREARVTVPAGGEATLAVSVTVQESGGRGQFVWALDRVEGTLPAAWLVAAPATAVVSPAQGALPTQLRVRVPAGTPAGDYAGVVQAKAMGSHRVADPGRGLRLTVTVP